MSSTGAPRRLQPNDLFLCCETPTKTCMHWCLCNSLACRVQSQPSRSLYCQMQFPKATPNPFHICPNLIGLRFGLIKTRILPVSACCQARNADVLPLPCYRHQSSRVYPFHIPSAYPGGEGGKCGRGGAHGMVLVTPYCCYRENLSSTP